MRPPASVQLPDISSSDSFDLIVRKLAAYIVPAIDGPHDFDELKKVVYPHSLRPLVKYLVNNTSHESVVAALLALRWHFSTSEDDDDRGLNEARAWAAELCAFRFVSHLTQREAIDYLCSELPAADSKGLTASQQSLSLDDGGETGNGPGTAGEDQPLLDRFEEAGASFDDNSNDGGQIDDDEASFAVTFAGLNALEVAAVAGAKKFLSEKPIQKIINGIWRGDIIFWDTLSTNSVKKARLYNREKSDPFCRLRVPLYLKIFEVLFFAGFLLIYYIVLAEKQSGSVSTAEAMLYVWLAAFSYNELIEFRDAGTFYATDFWASWDLGIIILGTVFFITRMIGIGTVNTKTTDIAFDLLAVEALFLVPRICSLLSLHPYFGMLIPALKEMTKDFVKFLGLVAILYSFDTTFTFLARGSFSFAKLNWILINVFFGSSYLDISEKISPILGPPLMLIFVCMTNILLVTSLISLLSNSLTKVMDHAREEYLFVYSVYVLEASTSNRLTYFLPPLTGARFSNGPLDGYVCERPKAE